MIRILSIYTMPRRQRERVHERFDTRAVASVPVHQDRRAIEDHLDRRVIEDTMDGQERQHRTTIAVGPPPPHRHIRWTHDYNGNFALSECCTRPTDRLYSCVDRPDHLDRRAPKALVDILAFRVP